MSGLEFRELYGRIREAKFWENLEFKLKRVNEVTILIDLAKHTFIKIVLVGKGFS